MSEGRTVSINMSSMNSMSYMSYNRVFINMRLPGRLTVH